MEQQLALIDFKDEDNMIFKLSNFRPSQQSVKAYVTSAFSAKQNSISNTSDISMNNLTIQNNITCNSIIKIDTINEKTNATGVTIEGVLLKDNDISCNDLSVSGSSTVVTQSSTDNSTKIATTAFVKNAIDNLVDSVKNIKYIK